ncbi:MAG: transposase [Deltaproteobacteria bacterium]|nr:MAG: transposase [Deltaproteobacteria bacterium]
MARIDEFKRFVIRQYGLLEPLNWDQDCAEHLYLKNKFWNTLVEIERDHRTAYRIVIDADEAVAEMNLKIQDIKDYIFAQDEQRKEARKQHRSKKGSHTKAFDEKMKELKGQVRELSPQAKELRQKVRDQAKEALGQLEQQRKEAVKKAYQDSGLWWSNYNDVIDRYNTARVRAMKTGTELKFHRFDGSGGFRCQIQGGMTVEELLSGRYNIAQIRMVDQGCFAELRGGLERKSKQSYGSRNYKRGYGVLSITVYTDKDEGGKHRRRMLDFAIILHRPLPVEATLKELRVVRKRIGTDFRWDVTFTFTEKAAPIVHTHPEKFCGIKLGWKAVKGGLRVATIFDGESKPSHIVMPQVIVDKLIYVEGLRARIDTMTNENYEWLLKQVNEEAPKSLAEVFESLKRAKHPHPAKFAKMVGTWSNFEGYLPDVFEKADLRQKMCRRLSLEHQNLRDKMLRRREDFYRCRAKEITEEFGVIVLDKMDLRWMATREKANGEPTELHPKARHTRNLAAISVLREWIVKQSAKTGAQINTLNIASSTICHKCGSKVKAGSGIVRSCLSCGTSWDKDENAAINLWRAISQVANLK